MSTLERAIEIAALAHRDQADKAGNPYISHPIRVALAFIRSGDEDRAIISVLHDVIEDSNVTLADLRKEGFSNAVVEAVEAVSRIKDETYEAFIDRAATNPLAKPVKVADLLDNMDTSRLAVLSHNQAKKLVAKYAAALQRLRT